MAHTETQLERDRDRVNQFWRGYAVGSVSGQAYVGVGATMDYVSGHAEGVRGLHAALAEFRLDEDLLLEEMS